MINKRLIAAVSESRKYVAGSVLFQWASLLANIFLMALVCRLLESLYGRGPEAAGLLRTAGLAAVALACRFACGLGAARMSYLAGRAVKGKLRDMLYRKLLKLGAAYQEKGISASISPSFFTPCWRRRRFSRCSGPSMCRRRRCCWRACR